MVQADALAQMGLNCVDTTQLRREINYDAVPAPRAASVTDAKSRARTSSSRTGSRSEGTSGRDNDSSEAVSKSTRSSSSSLSGARTKQSGSAQVGDGGSQAGDGGSGDGGSRDGSTSRAAGATHAQRGKSGMRVSASGSRPGYTRDSRIKYMPYALAVFSSPDKSYNENREAWVSERTAHDRAQSKPLSWSDTARLLLVTGGAPPVDAAAKANEFLHPAPPIPDYKSLSSLSYEYDRNHFQDRNVPMGSSDFIAILLEYRLMRIENDLTNFCFSSTCKSNHA